MWWVVAGLVAVLWVGAILAIPWAERRRENHAQVAKTLGLATGGIVVGPGSVRVPPLREPAHRVVSAAEARGAFDGVKLTSPRRPFANGGWVRPEPPREVMPDAGVAIGKLRANPKVQGPLGWVAGAYPMPDPATFVPITSMERQWLRNFQADEQLRVDGELGPQTWVALAEANSTVFRVMGPWFP